MTRFQWWRAYIGALLRNDRDRWAELVIDEKPRR